MIPCIQTLLPHNTHPVNTHSTTKSSYHTSTTNTHTTRRSMSWSDRATASSLTLYHTKTTHHQRHFHITLTVISVFFMCLCLQNAKMFLQWHTAPWCSGSSSAAVSTSGKCAARLAKDTDLRFPWFLWFLHVLCPLSTTDLVPHSPSHTAIASNIEPIHAWSIKTQSTPEPGCDSWCSTWARQMIFRDPGMLASTFVVYCSSTVVA